MKKFIFLLAVLLLPLNCSAQMVDLPFNLHTNTLYDFQHKEITLGVSFDVLSIMDCLYLGVQGIGAAGDKFFSNGLIGLEASVDVNKTVKTIIEKTHGEGVLKWLVDDRFPRIGVAATYNFLNSNYYKDFNVFLTLRLLSF